MRKVEGVYWATWRGKRLEVTDDGELVSLLDGSRWGHWFIAAAEIADRETPLHASAWSSWGDLISRNAPKSKRELSDTHELLGVRLLALRSSIPFCYSADRGLENLASQYPETRADIFFAEPELKKRKEAKEEKEEKDEDDEEERKLFSTRLKDGEEDDEDEDDLEPVLDL